MSYDYRVVLGLLAILIGLVSYVPYFRDIFRGTTKPHPFSWFVWGLVTGIAFFAQVIAGGGIGTWATGVTSLACLAISVYGLLRGEKGITVFDWLCFLGALGGIVFWKLTSNPLTAVVVVTVVDALGFFPTFRKAYLRPHEETLLTYVLSIPKWSLGLFALASFNPTTVLFPAAILLMNTCFVGMVLFRRKQLHT